MSNALENLLQIVAHLRDPIYGCPWDRIQTFESIAPYVIEEAYEVLDAIERRDCEDLRCELGDLLFQIVFQARIAEEQRLFTFTDVIQVIVDKLIHRHSHVFDAQGHSLNVETHEISLDTVERIWKIKKFEEHVSVRSSSAVDSSGPMLSNTVAATLPALLRACKISRKAAAYGFDWPDTLSVVDKVQEEVAEVVEALGSGDQAAVFEEIGDLLFSVANLARHAGLDPEAALRKGTAKFERRFEAMARHLAEQGEALEAASLPRMEAAWAAVKRAEREG